MDKRTEVGFNVTSGNPSGGISRDRHRSTVTRDQEERKMWRKGFSYVKTFLWFACQSCR